MFIWSPCNLKKYFCIISHRTGDYYPQRPANPIDTADLKTRRSPNRGRSPQRSNDRRKSPRRGSAEGSRRRLSPEGAKRTSLERRRQTTPDARIRELSPITPEPARRRSPEVKIDDTIFRQGGGGRRGEGHGVQVYQSNVFETKYWPYLNGLTMNNSL